MPCIAKKTLNLIEETGNDALIQVKRNQPTLFDTLTGWAQAEPAAQTHHTIDIGRRNRIESRQATVWQLPHDITASLAEWPRMCCLVRIERSTDVFNPGQRHWKRRQETAWYICTRALTAEHANAAVRSHWAIENSLHHVGDVAMRATRHLRPLTRLGLELDSPQQRSAYIRLPTNIRLGCPGSMELLDRA
jgi:predicted transposase YbfD/YdcC